MPRIHLTAAFAASAQCEPNSKKTVFWDLATTGFIIECRPTSRTYALRFVDEAGVQRQHKIGRYEDITFDQARKAARRLRSEVVLGGNPAAQKEERKAVPTYGELAVQHLAFAASLKSYSSIETNMRVHILPRWKNVRLTDIRPQDVASWLGEKDRAGLKPATVEKIRVLFGRSFELARRFNIPGGERNPAKDIPRPKINNGRQRFLNAEEIQRLRWAVEQSPNTQLKHIVGLLLVTGARIGELLHAKWRDIDVERRSWLIPQSKTGKPRNVPLSTSALEILEVITKIPNCEYVVPNPSTGKPFVTLKKAWRSTVEIAGLDDLRIHDLRHAAASMLVAAGVDLYTIGKILGHSDYRSTTRYSHVQNSSLVHAVELGSSKLELNWSLAV